MSERKCVRLCVMGSVDDGKSTLIGRILLEAGAIFSDQLASMRNQGRIELAWATDGLLTEREQGITVDVAYRRFSSKRYEYLLADAPGHESLTRNMASGATFANLGLILVDVTRGITDQTRRHLAIAEFAGIESLVLGINKMDRAQWSQSAFDKLEADLKTITRPLNFASSKFVPLCATEGANVFRRDDRMAWYSGPTLLEAIDAAAEALSRDERGSAPLRLPIQTVIRAGDQRHYAGRVLSGSLSVGDRLRSARTSQEGRVAAVLDAGRPVQSAGPGASVAVSVSDDVDWDRGDWLCGPQSPPAAATGLKARVLWFGRAPMELGASVVIKQGSRESRATVTKIHSVLNLSSVEEAPASRILENEVGVAELMAMRTMFFDRRELCRGGSRFILMDPRSAETIGAGIFLSEVAPVEEKLPTAHTFWMTGLPGSGKTTLANAIRVNWLAFGAIVLLDGDRIRRGLSSDLGFSSEDREENVRRIAEICRVLNESGVSAVVAMVSPSRVGREQARSIVGEGFLEIFVDAPLRVCIERDPKGLYKKALNGEIPEFTGISAPYDAPDAPALRLQTDQHSVEECVRTLLERFNLGALDL